MRRELPAATLAGLAVVVLLALLYIGSRGLRDFDSALIGYAVATVFATAAIVYRYTLWITRPPTWCYFNAGWTNFLSSKNGTFCATPPWCRAPGGRASSPRR
jgi:hypothetical protein